MNNRHLFLLLLLLMSYTGFSQFYIGPYAGASFYYGDLNDKFFAGPQKALGLSVVYQVNDHFMLKASGVKTRLQASDRLFGKPSLRRNRNLSFTTDLNEMALTAEYNIFNLNYIRWSPYVFGGFSVFHFDPYTFDDAGEKYFLRPLSTEGQGLKAYPQSKPYALTNLALPYGIGITYKITESLGIAAEFGIRKTFTDYIDDVSRFYVDDDKLLAERGPKAVELSYRGNTSGDHTAYPDEGFERGNPKRKDGYYFTGLHLSFKFLNGGNGGNGRNHHRYRELSCPSVPQ